MFHSLRFIRLEALAHRQSICHTHDTQFSRHTLQILPATRCRHKTSATRLHHWSFNSISATPYRQTALIAYLSDIMQKETALNIAASFTFITSILYQNGCKGRRMPLRLDIRRLPISSDAEDARIDHSSAFAGLVIPSQSATAEHTRYSCTSFSSNLRVV